MRGAVTPHAKIVAGGDQSTAKMMLPDTIDHHASRQWVCGTGNPAGQFKSSAAQLVRINQTNRTSLRPDDLRNTTRNNFSQGKTIASQVHTQISRMSLARSHHHQWRLTFTLRNFVLPPHRGIASLVLKWLSAAKDSGQCVVVRRTDGIELVVMTPRTRQSQPEHRSACHVDLIVDDVESRLFLIGFRESLGADHQVTGGDGSSSPHRDRIVRRQKISCQLLNQELVIGKIAIESINDKVSVPPGESHDGVGIICGRFRVSDDIQPMSSPAFPIVGRCEQPIHDFLISLRRRITEKRSHLISCWRQTRQVKGHPPQQCQLVCRSCG